ncbi:hypothetical protein SNEBB_007969 [Seison nebaliae]|nr:hypothetical protein SNEBB_007969 [Seison nebaliae]
MVEWIEVDGNKKVKKSRQTFDETELYQEVPKNQLEWENRWKLIKKILTSSHADIICLQEINHVHCEEYFKKFFESKNYSFVYQRRATREIDSVPVDNEDGVLIAWKRKRFELKTKTSFHYYKPEIHEIFCRYNAAVIVYLEDKETKSNFLIGTTHLLFSPRSSARKFAQLLYFLHELQRFRDEQKSLNVYTIICGDFNCTHTSNMMRLLIDSDVDLTDGYYWEAISGQHKSKKFITTPLFKDLPIKFSKYIYTLNNNEITTTSTISELEGDLTLSKIKRSRRNLKKRSVEEEEKEKEEKESNEVMKYSHSFNFKSVYQFMVHDDDMKFSATFNYNPVIIDHILYDEQLLICEKSIDLPKGKDVTFDFHMPNNETGSDHYPVGGEFRIKRNFN